MTRIDRYAGQTPRAGWETAPLGNENAQRRTTARTTKLRADHAS